MCRKNFYLYFIFHDSWKKYIQQILYPILGYCQRQNHPKNNLLKVIYVQPVSRFFDLEFSKFKTHKQSTHFIALHSSNFLFQGMLRWFLFSFWTSIILWILFWTPFFSHYKIVVSNDSVKFWCDGVDIPWQPFLFFLLNWALVILYTI